MIANFFRIVATMMSIITSLLLVGVTAAYVILTHRILKANRKAVDVMHSQLEASLRPYIVVSTFTVPGNRMICLRVRNEGRSVAENLRLKFGRDFYCTGTEGKHTRNLAEAYAFTQEISTFAPGAELLFYLGYLSDILGENTDHERTPTSFAITARYQHAGKSEVEKTEIDLQTYRLAQLAPKDAVVRALEDIGQAVKTLGEGKQDSSA